jgi:hypothetical protein
MQRSTAKDLVGQTFGNLTVLRRADGMSDAVFDQFAGAPSGQNLNEVFLAATAPKRRRAHWICQCSCGRVVVKNGKYLLCGDTTSCGCEQRAMRARGNPLQGNARNLHPREYSIWRSMKSRCYVKSSSNYKFYGAKGVRICDSWLTHFNVFIRDMGPCPQAKTIDRIDTTGDYEPGNCRWATWDEQHQNTRRAIHLTYNGKPARLSEVAEITGVLYNSLVHRIKLGETAEQAVAHLQTHARPSRRRP